MNTVTAVVYQTVYLIFYSNFTYATNKLGDVRHKEEHVGHFETEHRRCNSVKKSIRTVSILPAFLSENYILILLMEKSLHQFIWRIPFLNMFHGVSCTASGNLDPWLWTSPTSWRYPDENPAEWTCHHGTRYTCIMSLHHLFVLEPGARPTRSIATREGWLPSPS